VNVGVISKRENNSSLVTLGKAFAKAITVFSFGISSYPAFINLLKCSGVTPISKANTPFPLSPIPSRMISCNFSIFSRFVTNIPPFFYLNF